MGEELEVRLSAGTHVLTLTVVAPSQLAATQSVEVRVLPDSDGDEMPDPFEAQHPCLNVSEPDSNADPDEDRLVSRGERAHGADPCHADPDNDGFGDGEEVRFSSDPVDDRVRPPTDLLLLPPMRTG
jgi:hypothetical protein